MLLFGETGNLMLERCNTVKNHTPKARCRPTVVSLDKLADLLIGGSQSGVSILLDIMALVFERVSKVALI